MRLETLNPDRVEAVLVRHGAQAVTLTDAGNLAVLEPAPGETPLWKDTRITGLFDADLDVEALKRELKRSLCIDRLPEHRLVPLYDRAWEREWLEDFRPMRFGERVWICPGGMTVDAADAVIVELDPGLAFGTGSHATTALCLEWLDGLELTGKTLLDYGCGSGILAIAALKLGAARVLGIDVDPQAIAASERNAIRNGVAARLDLATASAGIDKPYDCVVANILAGPLVELAPTIAAAVHGNGRLALSGVLAEQVEQVTAAYAHWFEFDEPVFEPQDGQTWARLSGTKSGPNRTGR